MGENETECSGEPVKVEPEKEKKRRKAGDDGGHGTSFARPFMQKEPRTADE